MVGFDKINEVNFLDPLSLGVEKLDKEDRGCQHQTCVDSSLYDTGASHNSSPDLLFPTPVSATHVEGPKKSVGCSEDVPRYVNLNLNADNLPNPQEPPCNPGNTEQEQGKCNPRNFYCHFLSGCPLFPRNMEIRAKICEILAPPRFRSKQ